ncbi:hypothetical protein AMTRI_Chr08g166080 [Amborella trichopoda]
MAPAAIQVPLNYVLDMCHVLMFRMAPVTFVVLPNASWHAALIVLSSDLWQITLRQPWSVLTSDVSIRPCHVDGYGMTCQHVILVTSARLFPAWWRSSGRATFELELTTLVVSLDF